MKKYLILLFVFCCYLSFAQDIHVENSIAYIGEKPYVKIIKKGKKSFFIYNIHTNQKIIKVVAGKKYNERTDKYIHNTKLYFLKLDRHAAFGERKITTQKAIVELLFEKNLIQPNGFLNNELAIEYHETTPIGKRCAKTYKKGYAGVLYHKFRPVVGKDTIRINEIKFECVTTAFYTRKVLFDRFGPWTGEIYRDGKKRLPELVWKDIQLFEDDEKKFTVVARGVESIKTIYASIMIFDENNYDMLDKKSPYRDRLVTLFGDFIKNDSESREFYKVFWTKYDPARWKQIIAQNQPENTARKYPYDPSTQSTNGKN